MFFRLRASSGVDSLHNDKIPSHENEIPHTCSPVTGFKSSVFACITPLRASELPVSAYHKASAEIVICALL